MKNRKATEEELEITIRILNALTCEVFSEICNFDHGSTQLWIPDLVFLDTFSIHNPQTMVRNKINLRTCDANKVAYVLRSKGIKCQTGFRHEISRAEYSVVKVSISKLLSRQPRHIVTTTQIGIL